MQEFVDQFHFLRPYWLLALLPAIALCILLLRQKRRSSQWQRIIAPELLQHLLEGRLGKSGRWQFTALMTGWTIACVALAGPSWQRLPQPVHQSEAAVVILLDLSPSMKAEDFKPSRLQRSRYKLHDYLNAREEGLTALVAYAGEAHVVSPLTDDTETVANLLPALDPAIMPLNGSNVEMAVDRAISLFHDAGSREGEILLVTDGVAAAAIPALRDTLGNSNFRLSVLGVGTPDGAPIPTGEGGFVRDNGNNIVIAKLNEGELRRLSAELGGAYASLSTDDRDIQHLLAHTARAELLSNQRKLVERDFDAWRDGGQWLALLLLPFVALAFRRGWVLSLSLVGLVGLTAPNKSHALEWRDLWLRGDQQGLIELREGDAEAAAAEFESPDWRGTAHYRAEDYPAAANAFAQGNAAVDHYNRGNALAKAGNLQQALAAYEQALEQQPEFENAQFNANLIRELLAQQERQGTGEDPQNQNTQNEQQDQQGQQQQQEQAQSQDGNGEQSDPSSQSASDAAQQGQNGDDSVDEQAAQALADRQGSDEPNDGEQSSEAQELSETEQRQAQAAREGDLREGDRDQNAQWLAESDSMEAAEQQQALEQWLRQVPDDPSGLLRRKFEYEHRKLRQQYRTGDWLPPENQAYERW